MKDLVTASELESRGYINVVSRRHVVVCVACGTEARRSSGRCESCGRPLGDGMFLIAERSERRPRRSRSLLPKLPPLPRLGVARLLAQFPVSR